MFRPGRTQATYDSLSVIHDKVGEVTVILPLGSDHSEETKPPYGVTGTTQSYDVTFQWDEQTNSVVMAKSITAIAVSYTHLDVYKRQKLRRCQMKRPHR